MRPADPLRLLRFVLQVAAGSLATLVCAPTIAWRAWRHADRRAVFAPVAWWCRMLAATTGVRFRIEGLERLPGDGACVIIANHCSHLDGPILILAWPDPVYFVIKRELARVPLWGPATLRVGFVAIDRSDSDQARAALARTVASIREGRAVLVFPEGTRSPDGRLQPFKKGGFHLALDAGVPIVPVAINGSRPLLPKGSLLNRAGTIDFVVAEPVATAGLTRDDLPALMDRVREEILAARRRDPTFVE